MVPAISFFQHHTAFLVWHVELVWYHNAAAGDTFLRGKGSFACIFLGSIEFCPPADNINIFFPFWESRACDGDLIWNILALCLFLSAPQTDRAKHFSPSKQKKKIKKKEKKQTSI